jgi:hypothetical protein
VYDADAVSEVTIQPIERFTLMVHLFSDILIVPSRDVTEFLNRRRSEAVSRFGDTAEWTRKQPERSWKDLPNRR